MGRVKAFPNVTVRTHTALASFRQDAAGVAVRLTDLATGASESVDARYLVGCDGPAGSVREALKIELGGLGVVAISVNIFFRSAALATFHDKGWARFYRLIDERGCWCELIPIDGKELWPLTVFDEPESAAPPQALLRKMAGNEFPYEILSVSRWERRDFVAQSYGQGRVMFKFIAEFSNLGIFETRSLLRKSSISGCMINFSSFIILKFFKPGTFRILMFCANFTPS